MRFICLVLLLLASNSLLFLHVNATRSETYLAFSGGSGSSDDPYKISTVQDFLFLRENAEYYNRYFILTNKITFSNSDYSSPEFGWKPIGNSSLGFSGSFDGAGYSIHNLFINRSEDYLGLFSNLSGKIKNLDVLNCRVFGNSYTGCLAGFNNGFISNVRIKGTVNGVPDPSPEPIIQFSSSNNCSSRYVGIGIGYNSGTISNASTSGFVLGCEYVGGLVGYSSGRILSSHSSGNMTGERFVGGVSGYNSGLVTSSVSDVRVIGALYAGGLIGFNSGYITNGTVKIILSGIYYSGGIAGKNVGDISNIFVSGHLAATAMAGGVVGNNSGNILNATSAVNVSSGPYFGPIPSPQSNLIVDITFYLFLLDIAFGGIAGFNSGSVSNAAVYGTVIGTDSVGGIVGRNYGKITQSFVYSNITGNVAVGGLAGSNFGIIGNSFSSVNVVGNYSIGGLTGFNNASITNSFSAGEITGNSSVGGFTGLNRGNISHSYSRAKVLGKYFVGGLVGNNFGSIFDSYYDRDQSTQEDTGKGIGINSAQLQMNVSIFSGWSRNVWDIGAGHYPNLLVFSQQIIGMRGTILNDIYYTDEFSVSWVLTNTLFIGENYQLEKNGVIIISNGKWLEGQNLLYFETQPSPGAYNYTIKAYDLAGNYYADSVIITVKDLPPRLNKPRDIIYFRWEGAPPVNWEVSDIWGQWSFVVYQNGIKVHEGELGGLQKVVYTPSNLDAGEYNYTIIVTDGLGNAKSDMIIVTVLSPEIASSLFIDIIILLGSLGSFLLLGFGILNFAKNVKKNET